MPLSKGKSKAVIAKNIKQVTREGVRGKPAAPGQAVAIALRLAGKPRPRR